MRIPLSAAYLLRLSCGPQQLTPNTMHRSIKPEVSLHRLPFAQHVIASLQHNGIHAKAQSSAHHGIATVSLKRIAHIRAGAGREGIDVRNGAARTGFNPFDLYDTLGSSNVQGVQAVLIMRLNAGENNIRPKTLYPNGWLARRD